MKKKLLMLALTLTMVLTSIIPVMASESSIKEIPVKEMMANNILCPSCERGIITRTTKTYGTSKYHYSDGWCGYTGYHQRYFNYDETTTTCDTCSYRLVTKSEPYNEHCRRN